jgi:hypothetical protein
MPPQRRHTRSAAAAARASQAANAPLRPARTDTNADDTADVDAGADTDEEWAQLRLAASSEEIVPGMPTRCPRAAANAAAYLRSLAAVEEPVRSSDAGKESGAVAARRRRGERLRRAEVARLVALRELEALKLAGWPALRDWRPRAPQYEPEANRRLRVGGSEGGGSGGGSAQGAGAAAKRSVAPLTLVSGERCFCPCCLIACPVRARRGRCVRGHRSCVLVCGRRKWESSGYGCCHPRTTATAVRHPVPFHTAPV